MSEGSQAPDHQPSSMVSRRNVLRGMGVGAVGAVVAGGGASIYGEREGERFRANAASLDRGAATSMEILWRASTAEKVLALTFDDGPGEEFTPGLLDDLAKHDVRASFGIVGKRALLHPDLVRRQSAEGHEHFNHSWSHADLSTLGQVDLRSELERTNDALLKLTGALPSFVRPPFGRINGYLLQQIAEARQTLLMWHMRFAEEVHDSAGVAQSVIDSRMPGTILLAHDYGMKRRAIGMGAVPAIIEGAHDHGYRFVTVSEMMALNSPSPAAGVSIV